MIIHRTFTETTLPNNQQFKHSRQRHPMYSKDTKNIAPQCIRQKSHWSNKWSTNSPILLNIQNQFTIVNPLFIRLSFVKIFSQFAVHWKLLTMGLWHTKFLSIKKIIFVGTYATLHSKNEHRTPQFLSNSIPIYLDPNS